MEHNALQWVGAPSCQRGSYAFYKSVSSRTRADGPAQVWKLGEFYFIRCGPEDPVCIAEVTLLWEDQARRHLLASARLYFLPEDTPKGRTREHGEDEVVAVSRKMVVRVEDLVRWSCSGPADWSRNQKLPPDGTNGLHRPPPSSTNTQDLPEEKDVLLEVKTEDDAPQHPGVKVLSYPQYCRFRSLQRRIQEGARGAALQDPHLLALGGVKVLPNARVLYCRDTFNNPALEGSACFSWQFRCPNLSLRGRPRKRRSRDSQDSPTSSQSESWIDRMKENVMGSVEVGCEGSWLPHPEETLFLDQLYVFMEHHGAPIHKVPNLGFKKIDLFLLFSAVKRLGGYNQVTMDRLWKVVYNELGGCPGSTSAATCTRRHYERLLLPYEEHLRAGGAEFKVPESPVPPRPRAIRGRKPLHRGRKPGPKPKEKKAPPAPPALPPPTMVDCSGQMVDGSGQMVDGSGQMVDGSGQTVDDSGQTVDDSGQTVDGSGQTVDRSRQTVDRSGQIDDPDWPVVVKRGRGRPRGTRNKSTLVAQAKLLAQQQAKDKVPAAETQQPIPLLPAQGRGGTLSRGGALSRGGTLSRGGVHRHILPLSLPLTPDLSPMRPHLFSFQTKPKELKPERGESAAPPSTVLLSALPRFVGGPLGGFSPIKGVCPLDVRNRVSLQRAPDSPALTPQDPTQRRPTIYTLQPKSGSPDPPHPSTDQLQPHLLHQHQNHCSGCSTEEGGPRGPCRDPRSRPPLPPLRVLPLNLNCDVQVSQLMRTHHLGSSQLQSFTRRLSEALSQDLSIKPACPPVAPPPEQALPLNLSKRFAPKRTSADGPEPSRQSVNGIADPPGAKNHRPGLQEQAQDFSLGGRSSGVIAGGSSLEPRSQEEPADLSSPSRIRAFLLGLPPFQVKLEEDLNGTRFGKFPPSESATQRIGAKEGGASVEVKEEEQTVNKLQKLEERDPAPCSGPLELTGAGPSNSDTHCF